MAAAVALGKRVFLFVSLALGVVQGRWATHFATHWWENRQSIVLLTAINTSITAASEFTARSVLRGERFFPSVPRGSFRIHKQSLINIFLTFFASLFGGPVFFFRTPLARFAFFSLFGLLNSFVAQSVISLLGGMSSTLSRSRLIFDLVYGSTIKFLVFEWGRRFVLQMRHCAVQLTSFRVTQDFLSTLLRVAFLNLLGFKG